jgi:hypothetical protein
MPSPPARLVALGARDQQAQALGRDGQVPMAAARRTGVPYWRAMPASVSRIAGCVAAQGCPGHHLGAADGGGPAAQGGTGMSGGERGQGGCHRHGRGWQGCDATFSASGRKSA